VLLRAGNRAPIPCPGGHLSVFDPTSVGDAMRKRLQLNLGLLVNLGEEVPSPAGGRAFAAMRRDGGEPVVVVVHRASPDGPDAGRMRQRLAQLRDLDHGVLDLPLGDGDLDGHFWSIEAATLPSAQDRLEAGQLPLPLAVSAIRDISRALTAIHRRGITHGAINLRTVRVGEDSARLTGFGDSLGGSVRGDLDALGFVAWALLTGEMEQSSARLLSKIRRGVPPALDALCASFCARNPVDRPQRAEAVLAALDAIPTRRRNPIASIVDGDWHDVRPRRALGWLVVAAALIVLVVLLASRA
jgi:hypothetical protein